MNSCCGADKASLGLGLVVAAMATSSAWVSVVVKSYCGKKNSFPKVNCEVQLGRPIRLPVDEG